MKYKKYAFPLAMFISLILATFVGLFAPSNFIKAIEPLGTIFVNLMFTLVVPLVLFTITSSISKLPKNYKLSKVLSKTIFVFFITAFISAVFMFLIMLFINPINNNFSVSGDINNENVNILSKIVSAISVGDFSHLLSKSNMLALIVFSIILGISLRVVDKESKVIGVIETLSKATLHCVKIIMYYAPIGIFAYFAALINSFGKEIIDSYILSLVIYLVASILYFLIFYTLYCYASKGKKGVKLFYKNIFPSFATSLATQSSLATLPTNLKTAERMNIDSSVSNLSLSLGSSIHMEGSVIASILKIFFLFSIFSIKDLSFSNYLTAILISVFSGVVMSGVPGGGLIGEMLIVSLYGFPPSAFTIIATIGWIIDAPATMLNACGDIPSAMLIEKLTIKKAKNQS
jgi:Na+/H+-dicarboxylate symporter